MPHVRDEGRDGEQQQRDGRRAHLAADQMEDCRRAGHDHDADAGPCDQPRHDPRQSGKSKSGRGEHFRYTEEELEPRTPLLVTSRVESMWSTMYLASRPTPPNSAELNE
jgi:hypothetical protein